MPEPIEADHYLVLTGHPAYDWQLECAHDADRYQSIDGGGGCFLPSWWEECGMEMVEDTLPWPAPTSNRLPVDVLMDGDGPELVPAGFDLVAIRNKRGGHAQILYRENPNA